MGDNEAGGQLGGLPKSREGSGGAEPGPGRGMGGGDISGCLGSAVDVGSGGGLKGLPSNRDTCHHVDEGNRTAPPAFQLP